jgi:hypothetical protein
MIDLWQKILNPRYARLIQAAGEAKDAASIERLRREWPSELVRTAIELAGARRKAATKFPGCVESIVADRVGVEQATSKLVADHKAMRFAQLTLSQPIVDLCCGIGGDAMSLSPLGVAGIDSNPVRAWMAAHNANCAAVAADVTSLQLRDRVYHIDPSRRDEHRRRHEYVDYQPGPDFIERLIEDCPTGAIKLGPGVETADLPPDGEIEFISENGTLVQAVMWRGDLRGSAPYSATLLPENITISGEAALPPESDICRYLYAINPAAERAQLIGELCAQLEIESIHPQLGLLTADELLQSPWLTPFELIEQMPWRPRKVKQWLDAHHAGIIEVKTRGQVVNTDQTQKQLRGSGDTVYTVFILRWDRQVIAMITQRLPRHIN